MVESIGAGVGIWQEPLGAAFFLAWTADLTLYGTYYEWWAPEGRPRPTELETVAWMWVLGGLLGSDFAIGWAISEVLALSLAAGLDLNIRAPLVVGAAAGSDDAANSSAYFYGAARFLLPRNEVRLKWQAATNLAVSAAFRIYYPLFHAWDGEGRPFADQLMLAGLVGVTIPLGAARL